MSVGRDDITFVLDTPEAIPAGHGEWLLKGWCFARNPALELSLKLIGGPNPVSAQFGLARPDVAQHFNNPAVARCGFVIRFRCPPKVHTVSIAAEIDGQRIPLAAGVPVGAYEETNARTKVRNYLEWIRRKEPQLFWPWEEIPRRLKKLSYQPTILIALRENQADPLLRSRTRESLAAQSYSNWTLGGREHEGDFVVFLEDGDELCPHALFELVRAINEFPEAQIFYSDSDEINDWGLRSRPLFKPDFDLDLLLSYDYFGGLMAVKGALFEQDFLIRVLEHLEPASIRHIRKTLYHRRAGSQPYPVPVYRKGLEAYAERTEETVRVTEGLFHGSMRVRYEAPKRVEVGVFIRPEDGPFQAAVVQLNAGERRIHLDPVYAARAEVLVFIGGPLECLNHVFFEELAGQAMRQECGLVTGLAIDTRNEIIAAGLIETPEDRLVDFYAGGKFPRGGYMNQLNVVRALDSCTETFFAVRRELVGNPAKRMDVLVRQLSINAVESGLSILFTPYAVATFSADCPRPAPQQPFKTKRPRSSKISPNLFSFEGVEEILRGSREVSDG